MTTIDYPKRIDVNCYTGWDDSASATTATNTARLMGGNLSVAAPAQNQEFRWSVFLHTGTWTLTLIHVKFSSAGIATVYLDSTNIGTIDAYNSTLANNVESSITSIAVTEAGNYVCKFKMETKNASSLNYGFAPQFFAFKRTA